MDLTILVAFSSLYKKEKKEEMHDVVITRAVQLETAYDLRNDSS